jgi:hypothetical protein
MIVEAGQPDEVRCSRLRGSRSSTSDGRLCRRFGARQTDRQTFSGRNKRRRPAEKSVQPGGRKAGIRVRFRMIARDIPNPQSLQFSKGYHLA